MTDSKIGTWHMHSETTMDLGYRPNRPTSFPPLHCPRSAGARKRALCRCATCCEVGCRRVRTASIAVHERILTYRIATHCKPIANRSLLKNRAGGVVGKCRQLKIRFARHFGQARGLAVRNEKCPSCLLDLHKTRKTGYYCDKSLGTLFGRSSLSYNYTPWSRLRASPALPLPL